MPAARWCAGSTWSSATSGRPRSRRAASSPRRRRCISPISRSPIPRTASRRASGSNSWAKATTGGRCASPSVQESRSMADKKTEAKGKGDKPAKADKAPRPEKGDKPQAAAQQAAKGQKAAKGDKGAPKGEAAAPKARKPEERVVPRLKTYFEGEVRKKLSAQFGYTSRQQVPVLEKIVINMGIGEGVNDRKK